MLSIETSLKGVFLFTIILGMLSTTLCTTFIYEPKNDLSTTIIDNQQKFQKDFQRWNETNYSWSSWSQVHTVVLENLSLPRWNSTDEDMNTYEIDRLGDIWLPPRLQLADDIKSLEYGVFFVGIGHIKYARKQMVPMIRHIQETLNIPDANERKALRNQGVYSEKTKVGFALVTTREFMSGPLSDMNSFFDAIYYPDELPMYPYEWQKHTRRNSIIKRTKAQAMASSPFDTTIMLDFDSFPCRSDFAKTILEIFNRADIGLTNVWPSMDQVKDERHFLGEHNSAVVVLNMKSVRTRLLLATYLQTFDKLQQFVKGREKQRDQPALMVAMQAMAEFFHPPDSGFQPTIPNKDIRDAIEHFNLGFIRHVDFNHTMICRNKSSKKLHMRNVCGEESTCVIAHKDKELYSRYRQGT